MSKLIVQNDVVDYINGNIPNDITQKKILSVNRFNTEKIHTMGNPYPAKFIPEIPRWAIQKYTEKNDIILDPFVGSTTMVESRLLYRNCFGIDHNPLSQLIAKSKSMYYDSEILKKSQKNIHKLLKNTNKPLKTPECNSGSENTY